MKSSDGGGREHTREAYDLKRGLTTCHIG